jgi:succinoglycan biosynthesis protein ExoO/succinoglycan biosynthesis protein ExoU
MMGDPAVIPRVSVLMAAFNAGRFVSAAVESALAQTEPDLEVIVADDASTDDTVDMVSRLAAEDSRVRLLRSGTNAGPASARNRALAAARGRWVALLDADDAYEPHRLATLLQAGERHGADLVSDNLLLCPEDGSDPCIPMLNTERLPNPKWMTPAALVNGTCGSRKEPRVSTGFLKPVIRRAFLEQHALRYDEGSRFGEDFLFYLACILAGARWWIIPDTLYRYTVREGSLTEVQGAADLYRISVREAELLESHPMVAADPALAQALRRHKQIIDRFYYYRAFMDPMKRGALAPAARVLTESPNGFRHVVLETAYQAPRIAMKALRGGYGRGLA